MHYKLPLVFDPQPEGGYTVTCSSIPELLTEGDTVEDTLENIRDAFAAVLEIYREQGKHLTDDFTVAKRSDEVWIDVVVTP